MENRRYRAVVIGGSAGSLDALISLFTDLPKDLGLPIVIVTHRHPDDDDGMESFMKRQTNRNFQEASEKGPILPGHIYIAPADYHLLVERNLTFSLSVDSKVNYSRPAIDVLFESAAAVWSDKLIAILLTGASHDGAEGIRTIKKYGGLTIAQDPTEALHQVMPKAAIDTGCVDKILTRAGIRKVLHSLARDGANTGNKENDFEK